MREPTKKTIGDITFEVTPLGFKQGRKAFVRLSKALSPSLGELTAAKDLFDAGTIAGALEKLLDHISDEDLDWFAEVMGKGTRFSRDGDKWPFLNEANREALFAGNLMLFFQWLVFCFEVNFSDFLGLFKDALKGGGQG